MQTNGLKIHLILMRIGVRILDPYWNFSLRFTEFLYKRIEKKFSRLFLLQLDEPIKETFL